MATANFFCLTVARVEGLKGEDTPRWCCLGWGSVLLPAAGAAGRR